MLTIKVAISGKVQGVNYRHFCVVQAERLGINGWTRNNVDGTVTVVAQGRHEAVRVFLERIKKGPESACVDSLTTQKISSPPFKGFQVKR